MRLVPAHVRNPQHCRRIGYWAWRLETSVMSTSESKWPELINMSGATDFHYFSYSKYEIAINKITGFPSDTQRVKSLEPQTLHCQASKDENRFRGNCILVNSRPCNVGLQKTKTGSKWHWIALSLNVIGASLLRRSSVSDRSHFCLQYLRVVFGFCVLAVWIVTLVVKSVLSEPDWLHMTSLKRLHTKFSRKSYWILRGLLVMILGARGQPPRWKTMIFIGALFKIEGRPFPVRMPPG